MGDKSEIDDMYEQMLASEIGELATCTSKVISTVYEGDHAFALFCQCVKQTHCYEGVYYYRLKIARLNHDMLMLILVSLRPLFPADNTTVIITRSRLRQEMESLGIMHLARYVSCHKDDFYTLDIPNIPSTHMRKMCKILFAW